MEATIFSNFYAGRDFIYENTGTWWRTYSLQTDLVGSYFLGEITNKPPRFDLDKKIKFFNFNYNKSNLRNLLITIQCIYQSP